MISILVVDDSLIVRKVLSKQLSQHPDIVVVGTAADAYEAREQIVKLQPDVVTLDINMPRMDGLSFLEKLMKYHPTPVVVVSSVTQPNSKAAVLALALGAVDVVSKPGPASIPSDTGEELANAIRTAAQAKVRPKEAESATINQPHYHTEVTHGESTVLAIGASTGGVRAIETLLTGLPTNGPATVIVQHMPEHFTRVFAEGLDRACPMEVREACDGDRLRTGVALISPGNHHMVLVKEQHGYTVRLHMGQPVHFQRPSVDVLFHSVARAAGPDAVAVLLTGMGADGAEGLLALRESGAHTIAEDEESCVVFGMPRAAILLGAAEEVLPLSRIAQAIITRFGE